MIAYGRVIIEEGWSGGKQINRVQRTEESIRITNKQELLDNLFNQLDKLKTERSVTFTIYGNPNTEELERMVVVSECRLD